MNPGTAILISLVLAVVAFFAYSVGVRVGGKGCKKAGPATIYSFGFSRSSSIMQGAAILMSSITVRDNDPALSVAVRLLDSEGNPTDDFGGGTPSWSSSDDNVAPLEVSADGLSASITPGAPGVATISFSMTQTDGDVIVGSGDVTVVPGEAASAVLVFTPGA